jgi:hypothetical protein
MTAGYVVRVDEGKHILMKVFQLIHEKEMITFETSGN